MDQNLIQLFKNKTSSFADSHNPPWVDIFHVVFFPDRIYHAQYLNATRCSRYRYNVKEVRGKADIIVLKGEVFLDGLRISNFLRVEYKAGRLTETVREKNRFLRSHVMAIVTLLPDDSSTGAKAQIKMQYCPWINAYQVEVWDHVDLPVGKYHDYQILDMLGADGSITQIDSFNKAISDLPTLRELLIDFAEPELDMPAGYFTSSTDRAIDNYYKRNVQVPNSNQPSSDLNTVAEYSYRINFNRGFYVPDVGAIKPVRYRNGMFDGPPPIHQSEYNDNNIIEMRWVFQQEFGGSNVFFHEVTIPPGCVEGTHQHVGSEELYYCTKGAPGMGFAYLSVNDNPDLEKFKFSTEDRNVFGIGVRKCWKVPMQTGSLIFTKSGGIHGIRNNDPANPLCFVAFLYHAS